MGAYYIEVLDNIGVVDIYAEGDAQLADELHVDVPGRDKIRLPAATALQKAVKSNLPGLGGTTSNWVRIRAPVASRTRAQPRPSSQCIADISRPVSAAALGGLSEIACQNCGAGLFSKGLKGTCAAPNVRDLPSAHWSELVDCWMCHPEEDNLNVNPELMFSFEPERDDAAQAAGPKCPAPSANDVHVWDRFYSTFTTLRCAACACVLGEAGHVGQRSVQKLYIHRIRLCCTQSAVSIGLGQAVSSEILAHAGAHAVYKFVIEGRKSCRPEVLLHLVGWNAEILTSPEEKGATVDQGKRAKSPERFLKVLFTTAADDPGFQDKSQQWLASEAVELIALDDEDCKELARLLALNSQRLPPALRTMAGLRRSFLGI
ncbi:hypothetical protein GGF46_003521 [Coemansia sp. RSA 552]|nr:hypothetical protein GGF46_003521 [Coemansia sp. RSA 552]